MNETERDLVLLKKIILYGSQIKEAVSLSENSYDVFYKSSVCKNAVSMCVLQIGELASHLSDEVKCKYDGIPWKQICGMRNIVSHNYGSVDVEELWHTALEDIPVLSEYCEHITREILNNKGKNKHGC